ncbi:MAG: GAF domain-containing sensor histidine kinase [Chloroflexi bacterium]|nr:GAF domain-containing sensor histidine kinase [Chloroflexota bacterium]
MTDTIPSEPNNHSGLRPALDEALLMYRLAQSINAASTLQDIVEAVARLMPDCDGVLLNAFEHLDMDRASSIDIVAAAAVPPHIEPQLRYRIPVLPVLHALRGEPLWCFEDIHNDPRADPVTRQIYAELPTQALMAVPLFSGRRLWGLLMFNYANPRTFSDNERRLAAGIGDLVMAAANRIHSQQESAQASEETTFMYTLAASINAANTFQEVTDAVARLMPDCDGVFLNFWEHLDFEKSSYAEVTAGSNVPERLHFLLGKRMPNADWPIEAQIYRERMTVIEDVTLDPRVDPLSRDNWDEIGTRALLWLMLLKNGRNLGFLFFNYTQPHQFSDRDRRIALGISDLALAAIERIRLQMETVSALDETRRLNERIQHLAALEERTRLARELHDSVSQALYGIGLGAQTARRALDHDPQMVRESIEYVLALAEAALTEMRALIFELRPETLETEGLATALAKQGASLQARHGISVVSEFCEEPALTLLQKQNLYRIAREAMHNVVKHANATRIIVRMRLEQGQLVLEVIDDGRGFRPDQDFPGHLGLASIRERVLQLRGKLEIGSAPGSGTRIVVMLPLSPA